MTLERTIYALIDRASRPSAFVAMCAYTIGGTALASLLLFIDGFNVSISDITAILCIAALVEGRRQGLAVHVKLDRIIEATSPHEEAIGIEHQDADTIKGELKRVEGARHGA